jgi:hypothetical protein
MRLALRIVFVVGLGVGAIAAAAIGLDSPEQADEVKVSETQTFDPLIELAMGDYEANDNLTDSAPQQQVVNGWVARDLLQIIALQNEAQSTTLDEIAQLQATTEVWATPPDDRPARLLVVLVFVVVWLGLFGAISTWHRPAEQSVSIKQPFVEPPIELGGSNRPATSMADAPSAAAVDDA